MMDPETSDHLLLRAFHQSRDERALRLLMERHLPLAYAVALRSCGRPELAVEAAQDAFVKLARTPTILMKDSVPLIAWLHRTARHRAVDLARSEAARKKRETATASLSPATGAAELSPEALGMLDEVLEILPPPDRELVLQRYFLGRPLVVIAGQKGLSEDAVRMRLKRCLEKMRRLFEIRGVRTTTALLSSSLPLYGAAAPPAGMSASVIAVLGGSPAPKVSVSFLFHLMTTTQKYLAGASALVCAGLITVAVKSHSAAASQTREAKPEASGEAPLTADSTGPGKGSAKKTTREAGENAELIKKYGEARTRIALHMAGTLSQTANDISEIDRSPKFFEEQQGSRRYMIGELAANLDLRADRKEALLEMVPAWGQYASEKTAKHAALVSAHPSTVAESALAIDAWNQRKITDDEFQQILSRNGWLLEMSVPELVDMLSDQKADPNASDESPTPAVTTTEFLDDYPALRKAVEATLDEEQAKKYAAIPKASEPTKIEQGQRSDLEEVADKIEASAQSTAAWAQQARRSRR